MKKIMLRSTAIIVILSVQCIWPANADTALHNIRGYTSTYDGLRLFSVLVFDDDGRVLATGQSKLLSNYPEATLIDGDQKTVLPRLIDSHAHVYGLGLLRLNLDLFGSTSVDNSVAQIRSYAAAKPHARWITGRGWNQVVWPVQEFPTAKHIDAVVADRPVLLNRVDGHAAWANSAALKIAGVDDQTPDPVGGELAYAANESGELP
jgi:predicted amidohydrolase YtcJ